MEVQIISKEIIKPSAPTPPSLRTYKLCVLDQITAQFYIPMVLFYSPQSGEDSRKTSDFLKQSLSEALTSFYPLAGRIRNDWSCVDCNDDGVTFVEAKVDVEMSASLEPQNTTGLQPLLPCKQQDKASETTEQVLLAVQVNYFECGGIAVGVCMWHEIGDASSLGSFLNIWGAIARGGAIDHKNNKIMTDGAVVDCTSLFPPQDSAAIRQLKMPSTGGAAASKNGKRFVIDGHKLASLKQEIGSGTTPFEAVSTLIWAAATATIEDKNVVNLLFPMNLRKRLDPPLPEHCLGNFIHAPIAEWPHLPNNNVADYNDLAQAIRAAKRMTNNEYIRRCHDAEGGYLKFMRERFKGRGLGIVRFLAISSWCGFPFYDADFGWGKPISVCPAISRDFSCFLIDTRDGEGIEAWIGLPEEDMEKFLQDPGIMTHTSFSPNTIEFHGCGDFKFESLYLHYYLCKRKKEAFIS